MSTRRNMLLIGLSWCVMNSAMLTMYRETKKKAQLEEMLASGRVPYEVDMETDPQKSMQATRCTVLLVIVPVVPSLAKFRRRAHGTRRRLHIGVSSVFHLPLNSIFFTVLLIRISSLPKKCKSPIFYLVPCTNE